MERPSGVRTPSARCGRKLFMGRGPWKTRCVGGFGDEISDKGVELSLILAEDTRLLIMFHLLVLYKL